MKPTWILSFAPRTRPVNRDAVRAAAPAAINQVYHVAVDDRTSLNRLCQLLRDAIALRVPAAAAVVPVHRDFRPGDVRHSQADIGKARRLLGYAPTHRLVDGIHAAMPWYLARFGAAPEQGGRMATGTL